MSSCEDHGYVVDIGLKGISAFLKHSEAEKYTSAYGDGLLVLASCTAVCKLMLKDVTFIYSVPVAWLGV